MSVIKKICIRCNGVFEAKKSFAKRCPVCAEKRNRERHRLCQIRYRARHRERVLETKKKYYRSGKHPAKVICNHCKELKHHYGRGMCVNCYRRWWRINKLSKNMSEEERTKYFIKHGMIKEEKRQLSVEDLKRDLNLNQKIR